MRLLYVVDVEIQDYQDLRFEIPLQSDANPAIVVVGAADVVVDAAVDVDVAAAVDVSGVAVVVATTAQPPPTFLAVQTCSNSFSIAIKIFIYFINT